MYPPPPPPNFHNQQQQQVPPGNGNIQGGQQRFQAPPGGGFGPPGGGFAPPGGAGFAPPPPPGNGGFAPPPPAQGKAAFAPPQQAGGSRGFGPPAGMMAPPPPHQQGGMEQVQNSMSTMSLGSGAPQQQQQGAQFGSAPGGFAPQPMFQGGGAPPPPGMQGQQGAMPPGTGQPQMQTFQPAAPSLYGQPGPPNQLQQQQQFSAPGATNSSAPPYAMPPGGVVGGQSGVFEETVDFGIQIPERLMRFTAKVMASTSNLGASSKLHFGAVMQPLAPTVANEDDVDVVNPGAAGIVRCKRCRTYINAFVSWVEQGRRWRCNICGQINECPSAYFCHLDEKNQRRDRSQRPELCKSVVEFIAPSEYMVRPPQTPAYFFIIDVSATAVRSGVLTNIANSIKRSLDDLPGSARTQVGFITFDNSVDYYLMKAGLSSPKMMVVADLKELFVPAPDDLLVNLEESRDVVDAFLDNLPNMFTNTQVMDSCLGPALKAAFTVTKHVGGKMLVFQSVLPTLGDGALKPRENLRMMGTHDEVKLLRPAVTWYKDTAVEFSRAQISVDMFLFPFQYIDSASLAELPKLTAGTLKTYAAFDSAVDGPKFESDLCRTLTQHIAFESVMRIRCTKGMRISNFYGNFLIRGTDLLALPNCTSDSVFAFDLVHDEQNFSSSVITIQGALLYTSSDGERRIRVLTQALPVSSLLSELFASVDAEAMCNLMAKQAIDIAIKSNLENARTRLQQICMDIMRVSKEGDRRAAVGYGPPGHSQQNDSGDKPLLDNLKLLPLYTLALIKNVTFRGGTDVHPDERVQFMQYLNGMRINEGNYFMYPRMFSIHDMDPNAGLPWSGPEEEEDDEIYAGRNRIVLPKVVTLSVENLSSDGVFLLDNSVEMYIWAGRSVDPAIMSSLFGIESFDGVEQSSQVQLRESGNDLASRLSSIVRALRDEKNLIPRVIIVVEGDVVKEQRFFWHLVEDRASFHGGNYNYPEFMNLVNRSGPAQPPPPGGMPGQGMPPGGMAPPGQGMPPGGMAPPGQGMPPGGMAPPGQGMPPGGMAPPGQGMPPGPPGQRMAPPGGMQRRNSFTGQTNAPSSFAPPPPPRSYGGPNSSSVPPPPMQHQQPPVQYPHQSSHIPPPPAPTMQQNNMPPPPPPPQFQR